MIKLTIESTNGDHQMVSIKGEGEIRFAEERENEPIGELVGANVYSQIVLLNLLQTDYIDSSGVGWLLDCQRLFREAGGRLILHSIPPAVENVFRVLNMNQVFEFAANEKDATKRIRRTGE